MKIDSKSWGENPLKPLTFSRCLTLAWVGALTGLLLNASLAMSARAELHVSEPAFSPEVTAFSSLIFPGLGQAFNGNIIEGAGHFGTYMILANNYFLREERPDFIPFEERVDETNHLIYTNRTTFEADLLVTALLNLQFYSSYGAFRDARLATNNRGFSTPPPEESLGELALAPFNPSHLVRPTTWLPLILPLYVALTPPDDEQFLYAPDDTISRGEMRRGFVVMHEMVALGEEAFFRGVLNNGLSSGMGETWGLVSSSLLFGLAHNGTGAQASAASAGLFGAYLGYLQQKNDYRIGQGVAIHFWWNLLVSLATLKERAPNQTVQIASFYLQF